MLNRHNWALKFWCFDIVSNDILQNAILDDIQTCYSLHFIRYCILLSLRHSGLNKCKNAKQIYEKHTVIFAQWSK
jgi:hypothetical protein